MAQYPPEGISEDELLDEVTTTISEVSCIRDSWSVYKDSFEDLSQAFEKNNISEGTARIIVDNFITYSRKIHNSKVKFERAVLLYELYKKYFPDSQPERWANIKKTILDTQKKPGDLEELTTNTISELLFSFICYKNSFNKQEES